MDRKRRTEILIKDSGQVLEQLAGQIGDNYRVVMIEEPNNGLVMVKIRETAQKSQFYLGEVFVTECKVQINGCSGIGMIQGHQPDKAYQLAVVDAAFNARLKESAEWEEVLKGREKVIEQNKQEKDRQILRTKVDFETMDIT